MGLFDFLFGGKAASTVDVASDCIWMTEHAKFNGVRKALEARSGTGAAGILLIAHFADTLKQLQAIADQYHGAAPVMVTLAEKLPRDLATRWRLDERANVEVIVGERHPLLDMDDQLTQHLEELSCRCRLSHHLSLEDPLLKQFAGEWVGGILEKLGMQENEAIESQMVSRRVKAAQKKIQAEAFGSSTAGSAAEWMEKNLPNSSRSDG